MRSWLGDGRLAQPAAKIYRSGPVYEEVWRWLVQPEKDRDPERQGHAVPIEIERAEWLDGTPLNLD
jgi:hypothetical protein